MNHIRKRYLVGLGLVAGLVLGIAVLLIFYPRTTAANDEPSDYEDDQAGAVTKVETIMPLQDQPNVVLGAGPAGAAVWPGPMKNLSTMVVVQEPADVEPFYRADLDSQVAGVIKSVTKGLNDRVRKGELLAEVDAPDRVEDLAEKESVVEQRRKELDIARAQAKMASSDVRVAQEHIRQRQAEQRVAEAEKDLRLDIWRRYTGLGQDKVVTPDVVVEKKKGYLVAEAGVISAQVNVQKAGAELEAARAKLEQAEADIKLKETMIAVARKDRDRARAMLDYTRITAPWDGIIIKRNVDPGDFVQNATTAHTQPMLSVVRTDIMTVVMKVPDYYAPFVTKGTDAILQLPGRSLRGKVTRFSRSIHEQDRTMRVEVDLFNGSREEYNQFILKGLSCYLPPAGPAQPIQSAVALATGQQVWKDNMKGEMDPFPAFPESLAGSSSYQSSELIPRMYGYMKLLLRDFKGAHLIPSKAIFSVGGKKYILLVKNGAAHRVPVKVDVDDGRLAKVTMLVPKEEDFGEAEERRELTGLEEIVISDQTEIADGQQVKATLLKDWPNKLKQLQRKR